MTTIYLENMEFFGFHGCYQEEKIVGNHFVVNATLKPSQHVAAQTDLITDALNYQQAYEIIKQEMAIPSNLLEHVCERILNTLFAQLPILDEAWVKVSKLNPPMGGKMDRVSVTLHRKR